MSLEKAIKHGKERRKPYRGSAAVDTSCRDRRVPDGCPWCQGNRTYQARRAILACEAALSDWLRPEEDEAWAKFQESS